MAPDPATRTAALLLGSAFFALALLLLAWPIVPHDTDLWYHLNFGRRTLQSGAIPTGAWYAYVETQPDFADYYWLTQLLFYAIHHAFGFHGLITLRALLVLAIAGAVTALLARSELARASRAWAAAVGALALLIVLERVATVRPHMFSYLGLALCLLLIERGGRAIYGLLPVALLWSNLHGIEYPVLVVVLGGVLAEAAISFRSRASRRSAAVCCAALACVLATPFGTRLLLVPFTPLGVAGQEIFELQPVSLRDLTSFGVRQLVPTSEAVRALLIGATLVGLLERLVSGALCVRHLVWITGGALLLLRADRFASEFALLALPGLSSSRALSAMRLPVPGRYTQTLAACAFAALGCLRAAQLTRGPWPYPTADGFLPKGTSAFLRAHAPRGRVLHHPNYGGYLQWALGDRFLLGADMQTPFLFPPERVLELSSAYADAGALRASVQRWSPDFVLLPWQRVGMLEHALQPQFAPLAFDDSCVLYADRSRSAALVARLELRALPPSRLDALLRRGAAPDEQLAIRGELDRMIAADRGIALTRAALAVLDMQRGANANAARHAERAASLAPGHLEILRIAGEVALAAHDAERALRHFEAGLAQLRDAPAPRETRTGLAFGAARALSELGRSDEVYALLSRSFADLTANGVSAKDLQLLAAAAADAGESETANTLNQLAALRRGDPAAQPARR